MIKSDCLCRKNSLFKPVIVYKKETVFADFNGTIIARCQNCGLLKTVKQIKNKFDPEVTHADFYEKNWKKFYDIFLPFYQELSKFKKTGRLLDVGCSSGIFLELLQEKGFSVWGIEPNKKAFRLAGKKFPGKITHGYLKDFIGNNQTAFDIVVYNHVFEHIKNLNYEINLIKKTIKKGGLLVVGTPNTTNLFFYLRRKYWEYLVPLEHYWHFSHKYLVNYLERNGFRTINVSFYDDPRTDYPRIKQIYFKILSMVNKLFGSGEIMLVIAQKK